uniref:Peptidase A1 domain-containing protein n=1 Tax=Alexandrium monilatum TaxID=311494 RepID=A0A7S4SQB5_9DINO|mmetsp:Transcript_78523/g.234019  ORF Transcript_78523/g.234019 Transcript_78523/m.234019 type:complete len:440 (-) Transcript_78523:69-1388(-)
MDRSPAARLQLALVACCLAAELVPADAARRASPGERGAPAHVGPRGVLRVRLQSRARPRHGPATPPRSLVQVAAARGGGGVAGGAGPPPKALVGSVFVGTPPQEFSVAFDTGSGNLLLPGKQCISVACLAHRSYDSSASATAEEVLPLGPGAAGSVELSLGAGSLTGHPLQDSVCLGQNGELCATAGLVEATETTDEPFNLLPYDGVLGLGLPGASVSARFNFFSSLASTGAMESNRFAVWLATDGDDEDSEVTFGAASDDRIGSPDIFWQPLSRTDTGLWQVTLSDITADLAKLHLCGPRGCQAAFDTGTGVITGPRKLVEAVLAVLNIDMACANYGSLPTLGFAFGDVTLNIDPADYVQKTRAGCFHRFLAADVVSPAGPLVLLGAPFLQRYYSIFDAASLRVGLTVAKHKPLPGEGAGETAQQAAARLMVRGSGSR